MTTGSEAHAAPPVDRGYEGPTSRDAQGPAPEGEANAAPPEAGSDAAEPAPPAEAEVPAPPAEAEVPPPAEAEPEAPEAAPAAPEAAPEEESSGFEVIDLTEDEEALAEELAVETPEVEGASGSVTGVVKDGVSGQPLIGARIEAIGTEYWTKTDLTGRYALDLPPGVYELRVRFDTSEPRRISNVTVKAGQEHKLDTDLQPLAGAGQVVAVQAEMNRNSEGARMMQRRESTSTRDLMSRDEISKSGGGATTQVAKRMVGVTVVGGRYVFVRGLGHRYVSTLFDKARVPSPEPELRTVPLDIFPSSALSAINVQKTFSADAPGDFAGGSVQLESREIPDELTVELGADIGVNTATTFRPFLTNRGFLGYDAFGFGNLPRRLPRAVGRDHAVSRLTLDQNYNRRFSDDALEAIGESMLTDSAVLRGPIAPPNWGLKAAIGYGAKPTGDSKIGVWFAASYKNEHETRRDWIIRQYGLGAGGQLDTGTPQVDYRARRTTYNVAWSTIGLVRYDINRNHRLQATGFYSREAEDETRELRGVARSVSGPAPVVNTRLRYISRSILMSRLSGRHEFPKAKGLTLDWMGSYAAARRDDPSMRDMFFTDADNDGRFAFDAGNDAGKQLFLGLVDHTQSGSADLTMPFEQWKQLDGRVKIGAWVEGKQRAFTVRRFSFNVAEGLNGAVPRGTGNIINDATIGGGTPASQGGDAPFYLQENTRPVDNYDAHQEVYAGYAHLDLPFVRWFKLSGGLRFEASQIVVAPYDLFADPADDPVRDDYRTRLRDHAFLPALALVFSPTDKQNVRLGGSRTLARPEFRELAPFTFTDFVGGADVQGNPELDTTKIWNADVRWEWFPSAREVVAASVFYKYFELPIERVVLPRIPQLISFRNAAAAQNVGAELEARKNLEFIAKPLSDLSVGVNFTYIFSRVRLRNRCDPAAMDCVGDALVDVSTSRERPLQGQSPYVANAFIDYDNERTGTAARLLYNVQGRFIDGVGGLGLPDVYREPKHDLHLIVSQRLYGGLQMSLGVSNMLNYPIYWTQGGKLVERYREGTTFTLGLDHKF